MRFTLLLLLISCFSVSQTAFAQTSNRKATPAPTSSVSTPDTALYGSMQYRNIGPFRGGRASCVTGVPGHKNLFYMGTAGGGVWRTTDGGRHWEPISDDYFGGTVGGIAVAESDVNVIYAGGGEQTLRGNVSYGYGVWKSEDAGKTWTNVGLKDSRHIGRIRIHPTNHDIAFVAVIGDLYKSSEERGVYKTTDGGNTWKQVLFANPDAGAVDITFDANNPRILFASTWRVRRSPYDFSSGGAGSGLWRSTDSGNTWHCLTDPKLLNSAASQSAAGNQRPKRSAAGSQRPKRSAAGKKSAAGSQRNTGSAAGQKSAAGAKGLPTGTLGIIGITSSPAQRDRLWTIIEHKEKGGVYRSDDGGDNWTKINDDRNLRQRAWYYSRIYAHPTDADQVYVLNVAYWKSKDGGKSFDRFGTPHGDHHDLWINPNDPDILAIADDGGAQVSTDGSENWTTYHNQPTAQFYRVITDNAEPYRIYAAQQDNSTVRIKSRSNGWSIGERDWEPTAGCECGHLAPKPNDPDIVYGGCYDGFLERTDHRTGLSRVVSVYPDNPMGHGVENMKYRFQWNFPIFFSPHDPDKIYTASQHLHASTDEGQSWQILSPDLTRNDSARMVSSGGPITQDNTSVEYYCTIFAAGESPRVAGVLWTGSDDGLVHVSKDGGTNWTNVTPPSLPEWTMINSLEVDPHNDGGCYLAATRYKLGDYTPFLFHTTDYGATWQRMDSGIKRDHFTRVVRVDPVNPKLLFAGTESGIYISFNGGSSWSAFRQNMPVTPITDLTIKGNDLVVATQGRSLWVMDDISALRQLADRAGNTAQPRFFSPSAAALMVGGQSKNAFKNHEGTNPAQGITFHFYLPDTLSKKDTATVVFSSTASPANSIRVYSTHPDKDSGEEKLKLKKGANTLTWNARAADATTFEGMILWWADMSGPRVPPGAYVATFSIPGFGDDTSEGVQESVPFTLHPDPRTESSSKDLEERYSFHQSVIDKVSEAHTAIKEMRGLREQLKGYLEKVDTAAAKTQPLLELGKQMDSTITSVEKALYQTQNKAGQDPINFPIRLTNKLASLNSMTQGEYRPTDGAYQVQKDISAKIDTELQHYYELRDAQVAEFNQLVRTLEVPAIKVVD